MVGHARYRRKCLARTKSRDGAPCQMQSHYQDGRAGGRCRLHGGCSTGAKSVAGKAKSLAALKAGNAAYWARVKSGAVKRLPRPKPAPVRPARPPWPEPTPAERRQRVIADLKVRFPDRNWDD